MSKIFAVWGATGNQGGSVIRAVLADPQLSKEFTIRAIGRDVNKPAMQELAKKGCEVVKVGNAFLTSSEAVQLTLTIRPICRPSRLPRPQ